MIDEKIFIGIVLGMFLMLVVQFWIEVDEMHEQKRKIAEAKQEILKKQKKKEAE